MRTGVALAVAGAVAGLGALLFSRRAAAAPDDSGDAPAGDVIQAGKASFYGPGLEGNLTANGETFDSSKFTAAHKTLKFGTMLLVTDVDTGRSVTVRVNDRGPFVAGRILDLSEGAAQALGIIAKGVANVELRKLT